MDQLSSIKVEVFYTTNISNSLFYPGPKGTGRLSTLLWKAGSACVSGGAEHAVQTVRNGVMDHSSHLLPREQHQKQTDATLQLPRSDRRRSFLISFELLFHKSTGYLSSFSKDRIV